MLVALTDKPYLKVKFELGKMEKKMNKNNLDVQVFCFFLVQVKIDSFVIK